jgi:serralysin
MSGGRGDDTYYVDDEGDVVDEEIYVGGVSRGIVQQIYADAGGDHDRVITSLERYDLSAKSSHNSMFGDPNARLYGFVEDLTYTGTGAFTGIGNTHDNIITGGKNADKLYGAAGNDTLIGGLGGDTLDGGADTDTAVPGNRADYTLVADPVG